jgi:hypothetical protein
MNIEREIIENIYPEIVYTTKIFTLREDRNTIDLALSACKWPENVTHEIDAVCFDDTDEARRFCVALQLLRDQRGTNL